MIINVEFFDENPLENVMTSLNYKVDKTIFFGYEKMLNGNRHNNEQFLKKICGVRQVEFHTVDEVDLEGILNTISSVVKKELAQGNKIFFDLTGGESLPLVAFGILSNEFVAPMHTYDVQSGQLHEYGYEGGYVLSETAEYDPITLNLDSFISLYGGTINYRMHKDFKNEWGEKDVKDVLNTWEISRKYQSKWVYYSILLKKFLPDDDLAVRVEAKQFLAEMRKNRMIGDATTFNQFLDVCEAAGLLMDVRHEGGVYSFRYKNAAIKNYFWDSGSILEMYTYLKERYEGDSNDCRVGVHIDWDGVIHNRAGSDVLNEIDVLSIRNNLPTFISCKIGNADQMSLYELDSVANRFGGKYAKKVMVIAKDMAPGHLLRAKEMGIEVRKIDV